MLFENYIDIDGDNNDDSVALTLEGLTTPGEGFGVEAGDNPVQGAPDFPTELDIPTFQWAVSPLNLNDPLWNELEHLEVSS